ncbi:hypothetical protein RCO48_20360 [Peribacillus frigoritolerans]|nr:hypothetical protein [Peribacillus frigoritolerans]
MAFYSQDSSHTTYELFLLAQELADILKIDVDLINLKDRINRFSGTNLHNRYCDLFKRRHISKKTNK